MSHHAVRVTVFLLAVASAAAGGYLLVALEDTIVAERSAERVFESQAHEAALLVERLRTAQQSYVAAGQGADYWMGKLADTRATLERTLGGLASTATADGRPDGRGSCGGTGRPARPPRCPGADVHQSGAAPDGVGPDLHRDERHDRGDRAVHRPGAHRAARAGRFAHRGAATAAGLRARRRRGARPACARCCSSRAAGRRLPRTRARRCAR